MAHTETVPQAVEAPRQRWRASWLLGLLPLIALVLTLAFLFAGRPLAMFTGAVPPVEALAIQRTVLDDRGILVEVINDGADPVTVVQVIVDDAYWSFAFERGDGALGRLETAAIRIPYPWVAGEAHQVKLLTSTGLTFSTDIPVAVATPQPGARELGAYALLGVYVGIVPVVLGLLWYPLLRRLGRKWLNFVLALTVGLLVFLFVDTVLEALEIAGDVPGVFQGQPLVFLVTALAFLAILAIGHLPGARDRRLALAYFIALGIGFHNLGEGLAVGAAFALGQASLGTFLVVGFTLHNVTEGVGIAAPIVRERPPLRHFALLALLAGAPAILGSVIGAFAFSPLLAVVFLGIGAGAILQVIYEVTRMILADTRRHGEELLAWHNLAGLACGVAIMYFTAFLVA